MSSPLKFKRGQTFDFAGAVQIVDANNSPITDLTGWGAQSQIRKSNSDLVASLTVTWLTRNPASIRMQCVDTSGWPTGSLSIDVAFQAPDGSMVITDTASIVVVDQVTEWI